MNSGVVRVMRWLVVPGVLTGMVTGAAASPAACAADQAVPALQAVVQANRVSGVAPLAVFFDATASRSQRHRRVFHDLRFTWQFEAAGSAADTRWQQGAQQGSRDQAQGAVAAHVFDHAGVYPVCLTVSDGVQQARAQVQVTVLDPDQQFAGRRTLCFSATAQFDDVPAGFCTKPATAIVTADLAVVLAHAAPDTRLLLHRGDTFVARAETPVHAPGPGLLGAYGPAQAPPPRLQARLAAGAVLLDFLPSASDWRVQDLQLACGGIAFCVQARERVTLLRLQARQASVGYAVSGDGSVLADSTFDTVTGPLAGYGLYAGVSTAYFAALGNRLDLAVAPGTTANPTHVIRAWYLRKAVISDNTLRHAGAQQHLLKLHAPSVDGRSTGQVSEQVVIANNLLQALASPWLMVLAPQNRAVDERLRDLLVQGNRFETGAVADSAAVVLGANVVDVTLRDNSVVCLPQWPCTGLLHEAAQPPPLELLQRPLQGQRRLLHPVP